MNHFNDGHRNGYLDAKLGLRLLIALTSPVPGYADGYRQGQAAAIAERPTRQQ